MAYILGYIYADGSLQDSRAIRGHYLRITSIDKDRLEFIKNQLESRHPIKQLNGVVRGQKPIFFLQIGSKKLFNNLTKFGLSPKKSLTVLMPEVPKKFRADFIRGYFDGDGCIFIEKAKGATGKKILKGLRLIFTSGSKKFLEVLENVIRASVPLKKRNITNARRSFQLRYSTSDSVGLFKFLYRDVEENCYMKRKSGKFQTYFQLRPERIDSEVKYVLECLNGLVRRPCRNGAQIT